VQTIGEVIDQGLWAPRMGAALLAVFGGLCVDPRNYRSLWRFVLFGEPADSRNWNPHGHGRPNWRVLRLVVGQGMRLACAGLILGLLVAFARHARARQLALRVSSHDPLTFVGVSLVLALAAVLACLHSRAPRHQSRPHHRLALRIVEETTATVLCSSCLISQQLPRNCVLTSRAFLSLKSVLFLPTQMEQSGTYIV